MYNNPPDYPWDIVKCKCGIDHYWGDKPKCKKEECYFNWLNKFRRWCK